MHSLSFGGAVFLVIILWAIWGLFGIGAKRGGGGSSHGGGTRH